MNNNSNDAELPIINNQKLSGKKIILEFDPELAPKEDILAAVNSGSLAVALHRVEDKIRTIKKYQHFDNGLTEDELHELLDSVLREIDRTIGDLSQYIY
jgi:hypothetical protein